jgi:hypothetical protein
LFLQQPTSVKDWLKFFQDWQPDVIASARMQGVLDDLGIQGLLDGHQPPRDQTSTAGAAGAVGSHSADLPFALSVIALAGDRHALTVAPELAVFVATFGTPVAFAVEVDHKSTTALATACGARSRQSSTTRQNLLTYGGPLGLESGLTAFTVSLIVLDPKTVDILDWNRPSSSLGNHAGATILAVSAGFAVAEDLAVITKSAARNLHPVTGILVVNPDRADKTIGEFPPFAGRRTSRELSTIIAGAR